MKLGHEVFEGRAASGHLVTFVCYDDGYGLRCGGAEVPGGRWGADGLDEAMAAFRRLVNPPAVRLASPPAA